MLFASAPQRPLFFIYRGTTRGRRKRERAVDSIQDVYLVCLLHTRTRPSFRGGEGKKGERERERDDGEAAERAGSSSLLCEVAGSCCSLSFCLFSLFLWEGTAKDSYLVDLQEQI